MAVDTQGSPPYTVMAGNANLPTSTNITCCPTEYSYLNCSAGGYGVLNLIDGYGDAYGTAIWALSNQVEPGYFSGDIC
jgi:hypothetical protein